MAERVLLRSEHWAKVRAEFVEAQAGHCAICSVDITEAPQLDHCHSSGFIRGALCTGCNTKLGWYELRRREIETYLAMASEYIAHDERTKRRAAKQQPRNSWLRRYWQAKALG